MRSRGETAWLKWGLLLVILAVRFVDIRSRSELHPDEVYSVLIARCNPAFHTGVAPGSYRGSVLQSGLVAKHPLADDLAELYADNHDVPHASLYYMTLRLALEGQEDWNPVQVAMRGGILNLLLLAVTYLLLWRLMTLLVRGRPWLVAACCAAALLSPGAGECVVLVREYQMAMLAVVWYAYALCRLYAVSYLPPRRLLLRVGSLTLASSLCLSTGYLDVFYLVAMPLCGLVCLLSGRRDGWVGNRCVRRFVWHVGLAFLIGLLIARVLYAGYFRFLTESSVHKTRAFVDISGALDVALSRDIVDEGLTLPFIVALALCAVLTLSFMRRGNAKSDRSEDSLSRFSFLVVMAAGAVVSVMAVQYCSLLRQARYSYPYLPLLCSLLPLCTWRLRNRWLTLVAFAVIFYFVSLASVTSPRQDYGWKRQEKLLRDGAVFHGLNPNELPLLYPVVSPDAEYTVEPGGSAPSLESGVTVVHRRPQAVPDGVGVERGIGPLYIIKKDAASRPRP